MSDLPSSRSPFLKFALTATAGWRNCSKMQFQWGQSTAGNVSIPFYCASNEVWSPYGASPGPSQPCTLPTLQPHCSHSPWLAPGHSQSTRAVPLSGQHTSSLASLASSPLACIWLCLKNPSSLPSAWKAPSLPCGLSLEVTTVLKSSLTP